MGREDYHMFRIPYWDWRKEKQTEDNSPFKSNRLGETVDNNGLPQVHGDLYSKFLSSWDTICWQYPKTYQICNPQNSTGQLRRCPLRENSCSNKNKLWPSDEAVKNALSLTVYDTSPFNKMASNYSFRSRLEGFLPLSDDKLQACLDNKLCLCDANNSSCIQRLLHNSVSVSNYQGFLNLTKSCSHFLKILLLTITDLVVKLETTTKMVTQSGD